MHLSLSSQAKINAKAWQKILFVVYLGLYKPREGRSALNVQHNTSRKFIFPSGTVAGAGVLPETASFATIPGEMPEGKQPGESAAACKEDRRLRRTCVPPQLQPQVSPVNVPVPAVHQACIFERCVSFTILYWQQNWIFFSQKVSG